MKKARTPYWNAYPAVMLAGCFSGGILAATRILPTHLWAWMAAGWALLLLGWVIFQRSRAPALTLLACLGMFLAGGAHHVFFNLAPPSDPIRLLAGDEQKVTLVGRVADRPRRRASGLSCTLENRFLDRGAGPEQADGLTALSIFRRADQDTLPLLRQGDLVMAAGRLGPPAPLRNPADFDYRAYLKQKGIHTAITAADPSSVAVTGRELSRLEILTERVAAHVNTQLGRLIRTPASREILRALLLGDRTQLDEETKTYFRNTGLSHLLAVSGLHVLLIGMALYQLLLPLMARMGYGWRTTEWLRAAITMGVIGVYALLTGAPASVVRAVIMAGVLIGGNLVQREHNTLNALGAAGLIILLARPTFLFDIGFQLSFAAVGAILLIHPVLTEAVSLSRLKWKRVRKVLEGVSVSVAATLGTMPVLLVHFGYVSFSGILLNIAAIPLTMFAMAAAMAAVGTGGWADVLAFPYGASAEALTRGLVAVAQWGDRQLPLLSLSWYVDNPWIVLSFAAALLALASWPYLRIRWTLTGTAVVLLTLGAALSPGRAGVDVIFFDVGQADAALITLPNDRRLLVDTGNGPFLLEHPARTILNHLRRYGIRTLDAVVLTHMHDDHAGGFATLARSVPIGRLVSSSRSVASETERTVRLAADSLSIPHRIVSAGDTLALDPEVRITVLSPDGSPEDEENNTSVVLRVQYGETVFLLTGDAESEAENRMIQTYGPLLRSDAVKVAHHGSTTSSTPAFVERVAGGRTFAVVSGPRRPFRGLPNEGVLQRWRLRGAETLVTGRSGAVWLESDGARVRRKHWRPDS